MNASAHPPPELHLPDLPEVPLTLGPVLPGAAGQAAVPLGARLRDGLSTYLPLLLMAVLASGTWWLVKNTPQLGGGPEARPVRHEPDYTMRNFSLTRFGPDGRLAVRVDGDVLRHYPDTDRLEIDGVRIHAIAPDGRITDAHAKQALTNGDISEVQLTGDAHVTTRQGADEALDIDSQFLHAFVRFERLRSHLPVVVHRGASVTHAGGLDYDHLQRVLRLEGPVRAVFPPSPPAAKPGAAPRPKAAVAAVPAAAKARGAR